MSKKLIRAEACAELAKRIWPEARVIINAAGTVDVWLTHGDSPARWRGFNAFTSRDAAAELVAWLAKDVKLWWHFDLEFFRHHDAMQVVDEEEDALTKAAFLATPEQITLAACAALGIEVE